MKDFKLRVTYQVSGYLYVTAENKDEAINKARDCHYMEVRDKNCIDGSWHVDESDVTEKNYEEEEKAALEFWKRIRNEARHEWKSWADDYPEGQSGSEKYRRRERFVQWLCAKYHGEWCPVSSVATFCSKKGVCEVYIDNSWVEEECNPEVRMGCTLWHQRHDGAYENEMFPPSLENNELTIEIEK